MSEQAPKYHPEVEKIAETDPYSPDFGRIKNDTGFAHEVAAEEQRSRVAMEGRPETELPNYDERMKEMTDDAIRFRVGRNAVVGSFSHDNFLNGVAIAATAPRQPNTVSDPEGAMHAVNTMKREASAAAESYDALQNDAQRRHDISRQRYDKSA